MDVIINDSLPEDTFDKESVSISGNFYSSLLNVLGYPSDQPPVAELLKTYYHLSGDWLVVSPICWQATHNDAMIIAGPSELNLTDEESRAWFDALNEFVAPEDMSVFYCDAQTWLLQCRNKPDIHSIPVDKLIHQSLLPALQNLDPTSFWLRFITESQMYFSAHPLNDERGETPINGLWVWGGGTLSPPGDQELLCGDSELVKLGQIL